jgi:ribonuclease HI
MEENTIKIFTDGGARGNPGPAAAAFVAEHKGKVVVHKNKYLGIATNNVAEYWGVILALNWILKNQNKYQQTKIVFNLDSELVAKQLSGIFKIKNENLRNLFLTAKNSEKKIQNTISYVSIPRSKNKLADLLVNKCLDENK